jgi:hypothetical protein
MMNGNIQRITNKRGCYDDLDCDATGTGAGHSGVSTGQQQRTPAIDPKNVWHYKDLFFTVMRH